jgi:hypothetical protein
MSERKRLDIAASGGCQCGAVRYRGSQFQDSSHICHCRMCQKAVGNFFAALVGVPKDSLVWTRGAPARFMSSEHVARGFCAQCGTPLFYEYILGDDLALTTGSLDDPAQFPPKEQFGLEAVMPWFGEIASVHKAGATEETMAEFVVGIRASNHQHPDHDTENWPA